MFSIAKYCLSLTIILLVRTFVILSRVAVRSENVRKLGKVSKNKKIDNNQEKSGNGEFEKSLEI